MTRETQQRILKILQQMVLDLRNWLKWLNLSEAQIIALYDKIIQENGLAAGLLANQAANVLSLSTRYEVEPSDLVGAVSRLESPEYAEWLLNQPEPPPEKVIEFQNKAKDAMADLRDHYSHAAMGGPRAIGVVDGAEN
jgi:hypothetical protein